MKHVTTVVIAVCAGAFLAPAALAQPGNRNAIQYFARAVGESQWHSGSLSLQSSDTSPLTFEIGMFVDRAQGYGLATVVYKTYIDGVSQAGGDSASIVVDPGPDGHSVNTASDGRVGWFDRGAQTQAVFTNRHVSIPGLGFRISSVADTNDASAAGGISVKQDGPLGDPVFNTEAEDIFVYRFNITLACTGDRTVLIHTPVGRINSFATYNQDGSNTSSEHKNTAVSDSITLHASWVPAPSTLALLGLVGLLSSRRRRLTQAPYTSGARR